MSFLFKVSKRLARIRCAILLLSNAALAVGERTGPASRLVVSPQPHNTPYPAGRQTSTDWSKSAALLF
jgi:hypothetical protein